mgnify:CR=1 FL=1
MSKINSGSMTSADETFTLVIEPTRGLAHAQLRAVWEYRELLYEMLIGRPPFRATEEAVLALQHLHQEPPSLQIMRHLLKPG